MIRELIPSKQPMNSNQEHSSRSTQKSTKFRYFIGIKAPIGNRIRTLQKLLSQNAGDAGSTLRIVADGNLHITLKFIGSLDIKQQSNIEHLLHSTAVSLQPFTLQLSGVGFFRNAVWLGIAAGDSTNHCNTLAHRIDCSLRPLDIPTERREFIPHITVARFSPGSKIKLSAVQQHFRDYDWGNLSVTSICLFKSETLPEGAHYSVLREFNLD